ncbi:unknown [Prevotella sp. CAG:924]|nr:unknown [Prevotella sp. CAG:924]
MVGQTGYIVEYALVGMAVDQRVGNIEYAPLCVEDVHGSEVLVFRTDADHLLGDLDRIGILRIEAGDERVGIALFHHGHSEVVAFVHLVIGLFEGIALTGALLGKVFGVCGASSLLLIGSHVDDLHAGQVELQTVGQTVQTIGITQEDRLTDAFLMGLYGGLHHGRMTTFGKHDALRMHGCRGMEGACELRLLSKHLAQVILIGVPVGDGGTGDAAVNGSFGYGC